MKFMEIITQVELDDIRNLASKINEKEDQYQEYNNLVAKLLAKSEKINRLKNPVQSLKIRFCLELISRFREIRDDDLTRLFNLPDYILNNYSILLQELTYIVSQDKCTYPVIENMANELVSQLAIDMMNMEEDNRALINALLAFAYSKHMPVENITADIPLNNYEGMAEEVRFTGSRDNRSLNNRC